MIIYLYLCKVNQMSQNIQHYYFLYLQLLNEYLFHFFFDKLKIYVAIAIFFLVFLLNHMKRCLDNYLNIYICYLNICLKPFFNLQSQDELHRSYQPKINIQYVYIYFLIIAENYFTSIMFSNTP